MCQKSFGIWHSRSGHRCNTGCNSCNKIMERISTEVDLCLGIKSFLFNQKLWSGLILLKPYPSDGYFIIVKHASFKLNSKKIKQLG